MMRLGAASWWLTIRLGRCRWVIQHVGEYTIAISGLSRRSGSTVSSYGLHWKNCEVEWPVPVAWASSQYGQEHAMLRSWVFMNRSVRQARRSCSLKQLPRASGDTDHIPVPSFPRYGSVRADGTSFSLRPPPAVRPP